MADSPALELRELCHVNAVVGDLEGAVADLAERFGAVVNLEVPDDGERRACLLTIGGVIFELVSPAGPLAAHGRGERLARDGAHLDGVEFSVPDLVEARRRCDRLGLGIRSDPGHFLYTEPSDLHGISLELFGQSWRELLAADNPERPAGWAPVPPASHWAGHPLGLRGLLRLSAVVGDLDAATARLKEVTGAGVRSEGGRPALRARVAELEVGDVVLELLAPVAAGPLRNDLDRRGEGLRGVVFGVGDLDIAAQHLASCGVALGTGDVPGARALLAEDNHGLRIELVELPATLS